MSTRREQAPRARAVEDGSSLEMHPTVGLRLRCRDVDSPRACQVASQCNERKPLVEPGSIEKCALRYDT